MTRCNPYGYATDAGPRHLMGGMYGPEYAGHDQLVRPDGVHGLGICETPAVGRFRMVCDRGHASGQLMDLCPEHIAVIRKRMSGCCTACVWPDQAKEVNEAMDHTMRQMSEAGARRDGPALRSLEVRLNDLRHQMDELTARGIIAKRPLTLVEVS